LKELVPNANESQVVRAVLRYFAEGSAEHERIDLTEHMANTAGEGFLGGGEKVSQAELEYINILNNTLGIA
jgi:hypothetical protein